MHKRICSINFHTSICVYDNIYYTSVDRQKKNMNSSMIFGKCK